MANVTKIAAPLLLLAAVAGAAFYFLDAAQTGPVDAPQASAVGNDDQATVEQRPPADRGELATGDTVDDKLVRTTASDPVSDGHSDAAQGVRGRVLAPNGEPAAGVQVLLVENASLDLLATYLNNRLGRVPPPVAATTTGDEGDFALGILRPGKAVDLRVVSEAYPEIERPQIQVRQGDWYDAGDLTFEQGLVVQGRVIDTSSRLPIAGAMVFMKPSHHAHARVATPGRERGASLQTDGTGFFRFDNAPRLGHVDLVAEASGYASTNLVNQQLQQDALNDFTLEIERGRTITGTIVDEAGARIARAKVTAQGLSAKVPQTETVPSDGAGEFTFPTLRDGPYQLRAEADGYVATVVPLALTDEHVKVVMTRLASIKLKVLAADNRPVKAYRLSLKRTFPNNPAAIGNVMEFADRNIGPGDYPTEHRGEWAVIDGMPFGNFRFQLSERRHAKTLSPVFTIEAGADVVEVTAVLTLGASITGTVIDGRFDPVANALVATDLNGYMAGALPFLAALRGFMPEKHSSKSVRTDRQGRFRIDQLSFAEYMLRVSHEQYCQGVALDISLQSEGQVFDAGVIQLERGAIVEGLTMVDGQPAGQIEVAVSTPVDAGNLAAGPPGAAKAPAGTGPGGSAKGLFHVRASSDGDGRYRLLQRVPPGTYKITASRAQNDNPFFKLLDLKESERQLVVAPGQEIVSMDFDLPRR